MQGHPPFKKMNTMKPLKREELNQRLQLKTTQSSLLKIEQLRTLSEILTANPEALSAFLVLMHERHTKAETNSRQALEISRKDGRILKFQSIIDANELLNPNNSEILKLGKSIWNAIQKKGKDRKPELIKHELVHKDDYNALAEEAAQALDSMRSKANQQHKIFSLFRQELGPYKYRIIMKNYQNQQGD